MPQDDRPGVGGAPILMNWPSDRHEFRRSGREGRSRTLLWEVQRRGTPVDCEAWAESGRVRVLVKLRGLPELTGTFSDPALAVEWANSLERTLLADGWGKVI
jgi:hypothetical protein